MATVTVTVTPYPGDSSSLELEEWSPITSAWVDASDVAALAGVDDAYTATVTSASHRLRARWVLVAGGTSGWFSPSSIYPRREPTTEQAAQLKEAVIAKATRIFLQSPAALGYVGELGEMGMATVRPDYQIRELLHGLRFVDWDIDHTDFPSQDEVLEQGLQTSGLTTAKLDLIDDAIAAAWSWVANEILHGVPIV